MLQRLPQLSGAARARFEFWGMKPEHKIFILANTASYGPLVQAHVSAASSMGLQPILLISLTRTPSRITRRRPKRR
jgi:hypothetical protein